jgi:antitoxin ParD1/3/4
MQRVNLGKPYEEFIQSQVASGYFASASEVLRDALRLKMERNEQWKVTRLHELVQEGIDSIKAGRVRPFDKNLMKEAMEAAKKNAIEGKPIPDYVKP